MRKLIFVFVATVVSCLHLTVIGLQEPAYAAPCRVLQPADLRFDAPRLTARITPTTSACWLLPDAAGTVYQRGLDALSPVPPLFTDRNGAEACSGTSTNGTCTLVGEAPFTMTTPPLTWTPEYDLTYQIFRLNGDMGCPHIEASVFGNARERAVEFTDLEATCLTFAMGASSVPRLNIASTLEEGTGLAYRMFDESGAIVCEGELRCPGPANGRGTLVLTHDSNSQLSTRANYRFSLWDLASSTGCASGLDRRWGTDLAVGDLTSLTEMDCWWVDSVPGDQLVVGVATKVTAISQAYFLDESNQEPCRQNYAACRAGPGRYRFIVVNGASPNEPVPLGSYGLAIRSLAPDAGCVPIRPLDFGEAPSDRHRGIGCRSFIASPGTSYYLDVHDLRGAGSDIPASVYDAQGQPACQEFLGVPGSCASASGGRLTVVTDPAYADTLTGLYDLTSTAGCRPWAVGGLSYVAGRLSTGQLDCHLVNQSGGAPPLIQVPDDGVAFLRPLVLDDQETPVCQHERACELTGVGRHRVLLGGDKGYFVVGARSDAPRSCRELRFGGAKGVLVRTSAQSPLVCVRIPGVPTERPDAIHYRRVGGAGSGALGGLPTGPLPCYGDAPDLTYAVRGSWTCDMPTDPNSRDLVLLGNGTKQTFYVSRTTGYSQESPVPGVSQLQNTQRPTITRKAKSGNRLKVHPGRWVPRPGSFSYVWKVGGRVVKGATGTTFTLRPEHRGKRISVVVTAAAPNLFPGSATSRPMRIGRR